MHWLRRRPRRSIKSATRPGVPTTAWTPAAKAVNCRQKPISHEEGISLTRTYTNSAQTGFTWSCRETPPMRALTLQGFLGSLKSLMVSADCRANSRLGEITTAKGPSPLLSGNFDSNSWHSRTRGRTKTSVFPLPVDATPIASRPAKSAGNIWAWTAVGVVMPCRLNADVMKEGKL